MIDLEKQSVAETESQAADDRETVVSVRALSKVFKDFWGRPKAKAVNDVSFEIKRGEVFGLLGPNGSGKSTTIKMLLGLLNPSRGFMEIFGHSPRHVKTKERIGYLPEESYLYKYLDSRETLDFFGNLFHLPGDERDKRAEQLLDMVGLNQVRSRTVGEFSKGMQRRIGLAQALINDPDLVILDEPTAGLDPIGCREVKDLISALASRGKTVIISSHLLADVEDVCDRVVIYYGGKIQAMGSLKELLTERESVRVTMPTLPRETMEEVLATIRKDVNEDKIHIDNPTQNLESYFLGVVRRARESEQHTSGATSGSHVAEYLRDGANEEDQKAKILDRLAADLAPEPEPEKTDAAASSTPAPAKDTSAEKLSTLSQSEPAKPAVPETPTPAASRQAEDKEANEKLSSLLGGTDDKPKE
jgi:ABC-2 type transport system ATP-binding protein